MKFLVPKDVLKNLTRCSIVGQSIAVLSKRPSGGLLGQMQKGKQCAVASSFNAQIIEPALARGEPLRLMDTDFGIQRMVLQNLHSATTEESGVAEFIPGMSEIEFAKQWIGSQLGRSSEVTSAIGLDLRELEEFQRTAARVAPDPAV